MPQPTTPTSFIEESAAVCAAFPGRVTACSTKAGWRSLLVRSIQSPPRVDAFETRVSADVHISVMLRGSCRIFNVAQGKKQVADFRTGIGCLESPGSISRLHWSSATQDTVEAVHVHLPNRVIEETASDFGRSGGSALKALSGTRVFNDPLLLQMSVALIDAVAEKKPELYARSAAQFLAMHVLTEHNSSLASTVERLRDGIRSNDRRLARVLDLMHADYGNELALGDLARAAGVSEFYLIELFRKCVGTTPHRYLATLRLGVAAKLLLETERTVLDIALTTGHGSSAHFAAAFKRRYAQTPLDFRRHPKRSAQTSQFFDTSAQFCGRQREPSHSIL